jgi:hypothetical protein
MEKSRWWKEKLRRKGSLLVLLIGKETDCERAFPSKGAAYNNYSYLRDNRRQITKKEWPNFSFVGLGRGV